jgi:D-alanyl-D-alanine dipeptidase
MRPGYLVNTNDYDIKGINFYWTRRERFTMSEDELALAGVDSEHAYVHAALIPPLLRAKELFHQKGYEMIVKDAFRSPELYGLIQEKRYILRGRAETDKLLNMVTMPHATGRAIDINLIDLTTGEEVTMRNPEEDPDAFFIDFYKEKLDEVSKEYQRLQTLQVETMLEAGFSLGVKREFWHFEFAEEPSK